MTDHRTPDPEAAAARRFERIDRHVIHEGRIVTLVEDTFRFPDGHEAKREIVVHDGAVAILAHDDEHVWLTRQPREAIDQPDSLEIPAGRLDKAGEEPLGAAQRELAEEIGRAAERWDPITVFEPSGGVLGETMHLFRATGLREAHADSGEMERIEIVRWPLDDLDGAIEATRDGKTLVALLWLKTRRD